MNIKRKAALITLSIPVLVVILAVLIVNFPMLLLLTLVGGTLYFAYRAVLNYLEYEEKWKQ